MKSQQVKRFILTTALSSALVMSSALLSMAAEFVSVTKDGVNLRSGPGTNYEAIYQLPHHYPLRVLSKKDGWVKIEDYEGDKGWIYSKLVSSTPYVIVKSNECNVRSGPGTGNEKVGSVTREVVLRKVSSQGDWVQVSHPKIDGWIHQSLIWP